MICLRQFFISVLWLICFILALEVGIRLAGFRAEDRFGVGQIHSKLLYTPHVLNASTHLEVQPPPKLARSAHFVPSPEDLSSLYDPVTNTPAVFFERVTGSGHFYQKGLSIHSVKKNPAGAIDFDVIYSIDSEGRRLTIPPLSQRKAIVTNFFFFGTSNVFGFGLNDKDTMASITAQNLSRTRVLNYGCSECSPANFFEQVRTPSFKALYHHAPPGGGIALYFFDPHHLIRLSGSLELYRQNPLWAHYLPHYFLDQSGQLVRDGFLSQRFLIDSLFRFLSRSLILSFAKVDIPLGFSRYELRRLGACLQGMEQGLDDAINGMRLVTLLPPGLPAPLAEALTEELDQRRMYTLDYSRLDMSQYLDSALTTADGHPTPETNAFLANRFVTDLNPERLSLPRLVR